MTLKTSSRKINPFWNMIGFTLRKNVGIIIVLCIAALLYFPGTFVVDYESLLVSAQNNYNNYLLENFAYSIAVTSAIVTIFFNIINFSFLYKKSSSDVFHAFPLTRSELLLSRLLSGLFATLIPVAICYTSFGFLMAFNSWMGNFAQLFYFLLHTLVILLVCSSFSMIFVVSAGSMFDLVVSLVGANLALMAIGWIFETILDETLLGYNGYATSEIMYNLSPPYCCGIGLGLANELKEKGVNGQSIEFLIRCVIYIAVFTTASLLLYNRRKAEKGGTAYAYKFMYLGCSLLAGICGGFFLGMIFNGNITSPAFWFFAIIGCLLTAVVYGTVTNRGFKGVGKSILMGALSAIVIISVAISGVTGGFGYTTRVPQKEKIKSTSVSIFNENIPFEDPQKILDLHNAILETNATEYDNSGVSYNYLETVTFYYELENGSSMSRQFTVSAPKIADKLLDIYKSQERIVMINKHINITDAIHTSLSFYYDEYYTVDITLQEMQEFINAYWQDVQNCDESIFSSDNYEIIDLSGYSKTEDAYEHYFNFQLERRKNFTNTTRFIEDNNLVERAKQQEETYKK